MRKDRILSMAAVCLGAAMLLSGCGGKSAEEYVGEQISEYQKKEAGDFSQLLEKEIEEINTDTTYTIQFPEELKAPYLEYIRNIFCCAEFKVSSADKKGKGEYSVRIAVDPLDVPKTVQDTHTAYLESMEGADLTKDVSGLLEKDEALFSEKPVYGHTKSIDIKVQKDRNSFSVSKQEMQKLLEASLENYMAPYKEVRDIYDTRDFMQSYLDASFKGEFTQFVKHTGKTEEEARKWYETDGTFAPPADISGAYRERCSQAYRNILKQCKYSVGIPKKKDGIFEFTAEVITAPNNSFIDAMKEFESGTYYDIESASAAYVQTFEKYAANPSYGPDTTVSLDLDPAAFLLAGNESSDIYKLGMTICPLPE